jgi:hypothetical protein
MNTYSIRIHSGVKSGSVGAALPTAARDLAGCTRATLAAPNPPAIASRTPSLDIFFG